jgi:hypothetical protein
MFCRSQSPGRSTETTCVQTLPEMKTGLKENLRFSWNFTGPKTNDDSQCIIYLHENIWQNNAFSKGDRGVFYADALNCQDYIASMVDERNMRMKNWWDNDDRWKRTYTENPVRVPLFRSQIPKGGQGPNRLHGGMTWRSSEKGSYRLHTFLNLAVDSGKYSASCPVALTRRKLNLYSMHRCLSLSEKLKDSLSFLFKCEYFNGF